MVHHARLSPVFVGHTALALAAKPRTPDASLGLLVAAVFGLDLLWPIFLLLGIERVRIAPGITAFTPLDFVSYPWSHSLAMALVWGAVLALMLGRNSRPRMRLWVGGLVVSHWVLDFATHRPDLALWPGSSPLLGIGLWNSIPGTLLVEGLLLVAGLTVYLRSTRARDRVGSLALVSLLALQGLIWVAGPFSPPPPSAHAIAIVGLAGWLFVPWAAWIDRHREMRS
jgi:hypothetical protein